MRSLTSTLIACILIFLISIQGYAQTERYQLYMVHEDHVPEEMKEQHNKADQALLNAAREHKMKGMNWVSFYSDDNRVMYLSPIKSMADLDKNPFEDLENKMGKDNFNKLFDGYKGTYSQHGDYILRLDNELSYMPDGITQTPEGQDYRELIYYWIPPEETEKAEQLARAVKELYSKKGSKLHYRLYKSGFGNMGNYYMIAVAAKSAEEMEKMRNENLQLLGEEGKKIFDEIDRTIARQEKVTGYLRPDLSYVTSN